MSTACSAASSIWPSLRASLGIAGSTVSHHPSQAACSCGLPAAAYRLLPVRRLRRTFPQAPISRQVATEITWLSPELGVRRSPIGSSASSHARIPSSMAPAVISAERSTSVASAALRPVSDTNTTGRSRSRVANSPGSSSSGITRAPGIRGRSVSTPRRRSTSWARPSCWSAEAIHGASSDSSIARNRTLAHRLRHRQFPADPTRGSPQSSDQSHRP